MPRILSPQEAVELGLEAPATTGPRLLSPEEADALGLNDEAKLQAQYGTPVQQAVAGLEGAGQGLTFGLSTQLETQLGVDPKDIAGRQKANPKTHIAGTVAGIAAPAIATLGASTPESAVAAAAEASAPALASRVGGGVARAVESALPEATSGLGRVGVKAATTAAQGMTEGAMFGAGQVVHEQALGDPNLTAQSALEEIGLSALLGGGLGGAGGVLGGLVKESASLGLGAKLAEWLPEFEGQRNLKAAGAIQSDISSAAKRVSREELNKIGREAGEMGLVDKWSTPARSLEKAEAQMESAGQKMGDVLEGADAVGRPRPFASLLNRVRREVLAPLQKNPLEAGTAAQLEGMLEGYANLFRSPEAAPGVPALWKPVGFRDLHAIRKQISDKLYGLRGTQDPGATAIKEALHDFRTIVSDEINKGLESSGLGSAEWRAANREYQVAATIQKFAEKGVNRSVGNNLVSPTELLSGLAGIASGSLPMGLILGLGTAAVRRFGSGVLGAGARALRQAEVVGAVGQLAEANQAVAQKVSRLAASVVGGGRAVAAPRIARNLVPERIQQVQQFAQDPLHATDALAKQTDSLQEHAPQTAQALQVAAARGVAFLASKVPTQKMTPLGKPREPSQQEAWQFSRYYDAVNKPTSILKHAAAGTLTPMDVEAVKAVHPELFAHMQAAALEKVMAHKGQPLPYRARLMLSMLLGQDLDGTMSRESLQANQAIYGMPSQKSGEDAAGAGGGSVRPSQTGLGKLNTANRAMTPGQALSMRSAAP